MTIRKTGVFQPHLLAAAVALGVATQAAAVDFNIGEIEGKFDSSLSIGGSWSTTGANPNFISNFNSQGAKGKAASRTADDGRLNFRSGENFSTIFKGIHDLELRYGDSGAFLRGKYWYDFEQADGNQHFYDIDDKGRDEAARTKGGQFLDAFVYHNYNLGDLPGNVRLGKQVVNWGESTFIQNGISSINPVDVAALRRPGSEVKEALVPVNMFYLSQGLTENLTAEGFYQIEWDHTVVDNCGTFFGVDGIAAGCYDRLVVTGDDLAPGQANNTGGPATLVRGGTDDAYIPRSKDRDARDGGQYGIALRWFVPELNDTEFAAYAMNYHSRSPVLSLTTATNLSNQLAAIRSARYYIDYPEDIRLYGLSFATNLEGVSLGGELSFRPNMPLQINTADLNLAALGSAASPIYVSGEQRLSAGADIPGYKRMPVTQAQITATKLFNQVLAAERLTVVGEVGYNHIGGVGDADGSDIRFGRNPVFGAGQLSNQAVCRGSAVGTANASNPQQECNDNGFYTSSSWGYRLRAQLDYPNVFAGINLAPNLAWSQDVSGYGPNFEEGQKAISVGLNADYLNTYTASLAYTDYFGGHFNTQTDRDFVALSFGVNF
ncbi:MULTISPECIES: DUF1302 domain-containing protein [Pseudomonas]|uniref:DUF1302 domain-containing protein n=1 Tax=Pseudomonas nitroreducens TaxID=46680 RepID=UPI001E3B78C4|nr:MULTISPECIES: DUF1302 domain-containing protein [Pseudomonas]MCE4072287.1 DUF1302 domain-containing protein [Pseudomonas nitritireducens]MCE4081847.1 DUF1302 domain-containing protein [Pseudomonas nitroreducens]